MVAVRCYTFAHAKYIEDTLSGFIMQETTFPVMYLVVDDASKDGEQELLQKWAESNLVSEDGGTLFREMPYGILAEGLLRGNSNIAFKIILLSENHYSKHLPKKNYISEYMDAAKYIAVCEGDDYWISSNKLQKQVDFMECNCDYTLCFHSVFEKYEGRSNLNKVRAIVEDREYSGLEWYKDRPSQFASFLFRSWIEKDPYYTKIENNRRFIARDVPLLLSCAHLGKIRGMSDVMSVYRHNETGWTQNVRSKNEIIRIIDSQLEYGVFGKEFERLAISYYNRECVKAFIYSFKGKPDFSFIPISWKKSKMGTIIAFVSVIVSIVKSKIRVL